jgi:tetratricopeptide (TPR) repeat protein
VIADRDWEKLEVISVEQLDNCKGKSPKGFFYLGVALYKMDLADQAIKAYQKSNELYGSDPQLHYNIGLSYFKEEQYTLAVEHLKLCTQLDPTNVFAYNNLAFIYNMHQYYQETINVCNTAKMMIDKQMRMRNKID